MTGWSPSSWARSRHPSKNKDQAVATDALSALLLAVPGIPPWKTAEHRKTGTTGQPSAQFLLVSTTGGKVAALETQATRLDHSEATRKGAQTQVGTEDDHPAIQPTLTTHRSINLLGCEWPVPQNRLHRVTHGLVAGFQTSKPQTRVQSGGSNLRSNQRSAPGLSSTATPRGGSLRFLPPSSSFAVAPPC